MKFGQAIIPLFGALILGAIAGPPASAKSKQSGPFCAADEAWLVRSDATETGDRYVLAAGGISMDGVHEGDLFGWSPKISIGGEVVGDVFAGANSIDIGGTVRDSTRLFAQTVDISGTIEGDLLIFAAALTIKEDAHITGDVFGSAAHFTHLGRIDGTVRLTTGESRIEGVVGEDLRLKADTINFQEGARVDGDMIYRSRTKLPEKMADYVAGEVIHEKVEDDELEEDRGLTFGTFLRWLYRPAAAFVLGSILLALCGKHKGLTVQRMNEEGWIGLAVGVLALPVLAVASVFAVILVITIPLGIIGLFLLAILVFVGKIPTAVWLGSRVLGLRRESEPSPYLSLALGLVAIYLLKMIPYIGTLIWYAATSAGIGAMILAIMALRRTGGETTADA